ncbi:MAG TPA: ATP-binding protein [Polyangia bacterium]|nr:ATP-binding protein [Polyangia bacterium]
MPSLRAASIRAKLFAIVMITTASALVITAISMTAYELKSYREATVREMGTVANVVGANSTAALEFNVPSTAEEILAGAGTLPEVLSACLYDKKGALFASYVRPGQMLRCPEHPDAATVAVQPAGFVVQQPVMLQGQRVGTLRLFSHVGELQRRVNLHMVILFVVLFVSALVATLVTARLQRILSVPILELAHTAKSISDKRDYTLRATKHSEDEIGAAVDAFNQMLGRIEQADAALRRAGEQSRNHARILQSILDNMGEGMAVSDAEGGFLIWNPAATRLLGKGPIEGGPGEWARAYGLYRPGGRELIAPEDLPLARAMRGENVNETELYLADRGEQNRWISATARPFKDEDGNIRGGIVVFRDVSERKAAEEELRALNATLEMRIAERTAALEERATELKRSNEELEAFAYVASHDLQEPLRAMASYTQLLKRQLQGQVSADADLYIGHVLEGAARMRALINALLDYSRVGRRALDLRPTSVDTVFDTALADLTAMITENGAQVTRGPLPVIAADPVQLGQLFRNLVSNAIKFRRDEPPRIEVRADLVGAEWRFAVRDNGIGIEPKHFDRIFIIFQRLHGRDRAGTGIGLAVCKKIVERHGGQIWLESEPGAGSVFYFTLPARGDHGDEPREHRD